MKDDTASAISELMREAERGDDRAAHALFTTLYNELHGLAKRELARRGSAMTLSPTTLLHEAYLDIASRSGASFPDEARFMGYASRVMRGLIIDHARRRQAVKRGGLFEITSMAADLPQSVVDEGELSRISEALNHLAKAERSLAEIVDLKFFCGFSFAEIAAMRQVSERTVQRQWDKARIFLHRSLGGLVRL
ncbi:MAG: ECF-type sigma factor [Terriglobia bacterium]